MKVYIRTLGCEKNTVDSEYAAGLLVASGHSICSDPQEADILIVNSCGFINDAKAGSIDAILELGQGKRPGQKLYVSGCLSQRYGRELQGSMPEVDGFIGVNDYAKLPQLLGTEGFLYQSPCQKLYEELGSRLIEGRETPWTAPVKIAEGCNNVCSYCAIPYIRGGYRSRRPEDILAEAAALAENGCRELVVIAQDVTFYGRDFGRTDMLPELLHQLCRIEGIEWIRLMYCYEDEITQGLIDCIKSEPKICKYIDIPIQHSNDRILKAMNRKSTSASIRSTIKTLREQIPDIIIRTTLISGFPGETKEEYQDLYNFVAETRFDRLGVFAYSKEDGTPAARMKDQVRKDVRERRRDRIMALQCGISLENNQKYIGQTLRVLVEEDCLDGTYLGRSSMDAPEIDNGIIFTSDVPLEPGSFVKVYINDAFDYDLSGKLAEKE